MLAVGIHRQGVREAGLARRFERVQHGGALADVARQHVDAQARVVAAIARSPSAVPSLLPSTTTQTGDQAARAARTVS